MNLSAIRDRFNAARERRQAERLRNPFEAELDRNLAARKALRSQRSEAAQKGWQTRRGMPPIIRNT